MLNDRRNRIYASGDDDRGPAGPDVGTITKTKPKIKRPPLFKVLLLNDDFTPMDFVVHVLQKFFRLSLQDATKVMLAVHRKGLGVCGLYTYEIAETKVRSVLAYAKTHQHPLQCTLEEE
jgi:ATP-dependent Clp protease adaptor protein ClpS